MSALDGALQRRELGRQAGFGEWVRARARGRAADPAWARPALLLLLAATAALYLVDLAASGWANAFYAAAVEAGTKSWKAFFFGSFDSSNFITVDKPPASLWVMDLSARIFGLSSWSLLVPQALEGVASVALLYTGVKRWFGPAAGLLSGAVLAFTPVAALMFRFDNPDALLTLLLVGAAYALLRAVEAGATRWLLLAGALIGFGFLTKMLQALIVVPGFGAVYLLAAPVSLRRRLTQLVAAAAALVAAAGWWVIAVALWPAADRPYIGGSQDNSILNLIFGYNGFGRLTGNETGSVGGGIGGGGGRWGTTGLTRMFGSEMGTQISWLLPAALILLVAALWFGRRAARTDIGRAALLTWGSWLVVTALVFSYAQGIIHPYYTVVLAPAIGALVGIGAVWLWRLRTRAARTALALAVAVTAVWAHHLLEQTPNWLPWLRTLLLVGGIAGAAALLLLRGRWAAAAAAVAAAAALAAPVAYSAQTASTAHTGSLPTAGPTGSSTMGGGGPGGFGSRGRVNGGPGGGFGSPPGAFSGNGANGFAGPGGGQGFPGQGGFSLGSPFPSANGSSSSSAPGARVTPGAGFGGAGRASGLGGLLDTATPSKQLVALLKQNATRYRWVAAAVGSNSAAGVELATREPIMAIGGFNGTDPAPTLAEFQKLVSAGEIHYFLAGGGAGGGLQAQGSGSSSIAAWVAAHYKATSVGGVTVYDLTA